MNSNEGLRPNVDVGRRSERSAIDDDELEAGFEDALRAAFAVPIPSLTMPDLQVVAEHPAATRLHPGVPGRQTITAPRTSDGILRRRPARFGLAIAGLAAAIAITVIALPLAGGAGTPSVNAQELVDRASRASVDASAPASAYHLETETRARGVTIRSQTWLGSSGWRTESTTTRAGTRETWGIVDTGSDGWLYTAANGSTRAVRVASSDGSGRNLTPDSVADTLAGFSIPGCQAATISGDTMILGRAVWLVDVRPTPETCTADASHPERAKVVAAGVGSLGTTSLAIDKATEVTLRIESRGPDGSVNYDYEVVAFATGEEAAATGLPYLPPPGATVVDAADFQAAKLALAK